MELAVIKTGGKQYLVSPGQKIKIEKLDLDLSEKKEIIFDQVLLLKNDKEIKIGTPFLQDVKVIGKILEERKNKKVIIFKYKPKKRYQVKKGHRQLFTEVEIIKIETA